MKLSKLISTFENFLTWNAKELEKNKSEINELINKLYEKKKDINKEIKKSYSKKDKNELNDKLEAVKKLIKKAKKEFI